MRCMSVHGRVAVGKAMVRSMMLLLGGLVGVWFGFWFFGKLGLNF